MSYLAITHVYSFRWHILNGHSLIEMQAILIELLENLEFSPAPGNIEIIRGATGLITPMWAELSALTDLSSFLYHSRIKGSDSRRTELPLTVTPISTWPHSYKEDTFILIVRSYHGPRNLTTIFLSVYKCNLFLVYLFSILTTCMNRMAAPSPSPRKPAREFFLFQAHQLTYSQTRPQLLGQNY